MPLPWLRLWEGQGFLLCFGHHLHEKEKTSFLLQCGLAPIFSWRLRKKGDYEGLSAEGAFRLRFSGPWLGVSPSSVPAELATVQAELSNSAFILQ